MSTTTRRRKGAGNTTRPDPQATITQAILTQLVAGTVPWRQPWSSTGGLPTNLATRNPYRGINTVMFAMRGWGDRHWLTYNQARELGGQVRKGEHGTPGMRWLETRHPVDAADVPALKTRGAVVRRDDDGAPYVLRMGRKTFTAFNLLQIDGIERPNVPPIKWNPLERAEAVMRGWEGGPAIRDGGDAAQYREGGDTVYLPDRGRFTDPADYYHAAFHELVHSTGARQRLGRDMTGEFGSRPYALEELTAEIGAAFLCAHVGIDPPIPTSASYIANWLTVLDNDHGLIVPAAQAAQKAVDQIVAGEDG